MNDRTSLPLRVLYEDNHIIIINKRPGDIVQADKTGDQPLVEKVREYIKEKYKKPGNVFLAVVHRIDRPVSGIVMFARTSKAMERVNKIFHNKEIQKKYWAVVKGVPDPLEGKLIHYLIKDEAKNKSRAYETEHPHTSRSELDYKVIAKSDLYSLLEITLHTGRHHQIRVQLSYIGWPIKGDLKYGFDRSNKGGFIHLHAHELSFVHPVKKELIHITCPPPDDVLWNFFNEQVSGDSQSKISISEINN